MGMDEVPPVQRQPAHRGRGAPVGRGDEDGRVSSGAVHGKGLRGYARHVSVGHRDVRRPRHRQEPRGDHPGQQRLSGRQPRHQGARDADRRLPEHKPDAIGFSGLLVKSAQQMVVTAHLSGGRHRHPAFVGAASPASSRPPGSPPSTPASRSTPWPWRAWTWPISCSRRPRGRGSSSAYAASPGAHRRRPGGGRPSGADALPPARVYSERVEPPSPPDLEPHVLREVPLTHIYPYLNLQMLYGKHLGLRGLVSRMLADGDPRPAKFTRRWKRPSRRRCRTVCSALTGSTSGFGAGSR